MTENPEFAAEEPRSGSSAPGLEGEGGQYVDGDYGDAGAVDRPAEGADEGQYLEGDYGKAGPAGTRAENTGEDGQYEDGDYGDAGPIHEPERGLADGEYEEGDYGDAGTAGDARTEDAIREGLTGGGQMQATTEERGPLHGDRGTER